MYDIFNVNYNKVMQNLRAIGVLPAPLGGLPLPPGLDGSNPRICYPADELGVAASGGRDRHLAEPRSYNRAGSNVGSLGPSQDTPPQGPKPFGITHETYTNVRDRPRYKANPHHYGRKPTPNDYKLNKLIDRADDGSNTTVMLANIPVDLTANQCIDSLDAAGFFAAYDYIRFKVC